MFIKMISIFVYSCQISWVSAAIFIKGPCPDVKPVENFNLTALTGTWYEIARYPNSIEEQGDCEFVDYVPDNGHLKLKGSGVFNGQVNKFEGYVNYATNAGNTGSLSYYSTLLEVKEGTTEEPALIVDVDYDKHVISYECKYDKSKDMRHDFAWVISRSKTLEGDDKRAVENFIKNSGYINPDLFTWQHFDAKTCAESV